MENIILQTKKKWYKKTRYQVLIIGMAIFAIFIFIGIANSGTPLLMDVPKKVSEQKLILEGFNTEAEADVKIYLNDIIVSELKANNKGNFTLEVALAEGENILYAEALHDGKTLKGNTYRIVYENKPKEVVAITDENSEKEIQNENLESEENFNTEQSVTSEEVQPQQVEGNTNNSADTNSNQPTPQETTTKPLSEEEQIKQLVSEQFKDDKEAVRKIEVIEQIDGGWGVFVEYNAKDSITANFHRKSIEIKMTDIYYALYTSGQDIRTASVSAYSPLTDKYGNTSEGVVYKTMLEKDEASKVNWSIDKPVLQINILPKVWETTFIHPEFQK